MNCKDYEMEIALWVGGDLSPDQIPRVERHVAGCPGCAELAHELRALRRELSEVQEPEITDGDLASVRRNVLDRIPGRRAAVLPWLAAAAAVVLTAGVLVLHQFSVPVAPLPAISRAPVPPPVPSDVPLIGMPPKAPVKRPLRMDRSVEQAIERFARELARQREAPPEKMEPAQGIRIATSNKNVIVLLVPETRGEL
ncbi:MAG: zf-HC2 domain-containing protein [Bryobacteraceae bacterium]|nr:zf-HC2 domain-containing protein [Bryobacteraceae bacterium]